MAASEAKVLGYGGISLVQRASGLSRRVIARGIREIAEGVTLPAGRVRRLGGGRKLLVVSDPQIVDVLDSMIADHTRGDPESPLRWVCKSTRTLARALTRRGHSVSHTTVAQLLHDLDYSLQSNRKTEEGRDHPDRGRALRCGRTWRDASRRVTDGDADAGAVVAPRRSDRPIARGLARRFAASGRRSRCARRLGRRSGARTLLNRLEEVVDAIEIVLHPRRRVAVGESTRRRGSRVRAHRRDRL